MKMMVNIWYVVAALCFYRAIDLYLFPYVDFEENDEKDN